jgi:nitrate/nitrite transporter NarK
VSVREFDPCSTNAQQLREWRFGWRVVVAASAGTGIGYPMFLMTAGLFIRPLREEFGWSTSEAAIAPKVLLIGALLSPLGGLIVDRFGARRVALIGLTLLLPAYLWLANLDASRIQLYFVVAFIGCIAPLSNPTVFTSAVGTWFDKSAGTAFGVTMAGVALVSVIVLPIIARLISELGWRAGYLALAAVVLLVGLPIVAALFRSRPTISAMPGEAHPLDGVPLRLAIQDLRFWVYLVAFSVAATPMGAFLSHLMPILMRNGFEASTAAAMGVVLAASLGIGRLSAGFMLDRLWPNGVAFAYLLIPAIGAFWLPNITPVEPLFFLALAVFFLGFAHGAEADFLAFFMRRLFGMRAYSTLFGILAMTTAMGMAGGGMAFSLLVDTYGTYELACYLASAAFLISAALVLVAGCLDARWQGRDALLNVEIHVK